MHICDNWLHSRHYAHILQQSHVFHGLYTKLHSKCDNISGIVGNAHLSFDSGEIRVWGELIWTDYNLPRQLIRCPELFFSGEPISCRYIFALDTNFITIEGCSQYNIFHGLCINNKCLWWPWLSKDAFVISSLDNPNTLSSGQVIICPDQFPPNTNFTTIER